MGEKRGETHRARKRRGSGRPMGRAGSMRPPPRHLQAMEAAWLPAEVAGFAALHPWLVSVPYRDGHPVLVLPGFLGGDAATVALRAVLRQRGYWAHRWRLGRHLAPSRRIVEGMRHRLEE